MGSLEKQRLPLYSGQLQPQVDGRQRGISKMAILRVATAAILSLVLLIVCLPTVYTSPVFTRDRQHPGEASGEIEAGKLGAVASESALCSRYGTNMLEKGGNAADALVATSVCVGTVAMYHSGIGGGGFMLVRAPDGSFESIDYRETAPAAAFQNMFVNNTEASTKGGLASGVPGDFRGLEYLHNKYGSLPWSTVLQPAIQTAREGFTVNEDLLHYIDTAITENGNEDFLCTDPSWAIDFCPHGTRLVLGETMTRKRYADTLEAIAKQGPDVFYSGPMAEATIRAVQSANGTMTLDDLREYTAVTRDTAQIDYRGFTVTSTTAPTSGAIGLSILKILEGYGDFFASDSVNISTHRLDEALRFGYGERTLLGDPFFVDGMKEYQADILKQSTINEIRNKISDYRTQNVSVYDPEGLESIETPGTSHISVVDHTGLAISTTTTINTLFGSKVMVPETGIVMNNEMNDFSTPGSSSSFGYIPSEANYIRPHKRPLSSTTPTIITHPSNGTLFFIAGSAGGSRIITATVQNIIHVVDRGLSAAEALAQPRLHDQLIPNQVAFEWTFDNATVRDMQRRGHNVTWMELGKSTAQVVRVLGDGGFEAAGEPRQRNSGGIVV